MKKGRIHIALVGNPNSGKTSLFNALTGMNQNVGNFPGVTVDKKTGICQLSETLTAEVIDLPGTYSLYPRRSDEWVSYRVLMSQDKEVKPDMVVLVADASNLKRNLLFASQILDLKTPVIIALTMADIARKKGIEIDLPDLQRELGVPVVIINPRKNKGITELKRTITHAIQLQSAVITRDFINYRELASEPIKKVKELLPEISDYSAIHYLINHESFELNDALQDKIENIERLHQFNHTKVQAEEIMQRYGRIKNIMQQSVVEEDPKRKELFAEKLDRILLHRFWGYIILLSVLFLLFQSIFWVAQYPMDAIEWGFSRLSGWLLNTLPDTLITDLFINGILAGLSGILVFVPQIMILFGLITILEDSGYMARISFLTDKLMRKVGLNGKSVMPLVSGFACAVPAIMSTRNIENRKERLLTIMITPLMSCSARLPVFIIIISLIIPNTYYLGFLSLQGLTMMGLYLLGLFFGLIVAWVMSRIIKIKEKSFFILELPVYRAPRWKNIFITMTEKAKIFVRDAGKVIMVISLFLWGLSSYGPKEKMASVKQRYDKLIELNPSEKDDLIRKMNAEHLESSYAGILGKTIQPLIQPLGYDWKIGIALITSFAAREVFVGTMATLYSVEGTSSKDNPTLRKKMAAAVKEDGTKVYSFASGISLMIFYLLAMQCMSTLAVVGRETKSWKWPMIQLIYMTALAYVVSLIVYQFLK